MTEQPCVADGSNRLLDIWNVPLASAPWGRTKVSAGVTGVDPEELLGIPTEAIEVKVTEDEHGNTRQLGPGQLVFIPANSYHANHNPLVEELRCYILKLPPTGSVEVSEIEG